MTTTQTPAVQETAPAAVKKPNALQAMASRLAVDPKKLLDTLKKTAFSSAKNDQQIMALVVVANQYGLDPFTKEIYAFPGKGGEIVPVVSVDGWIRLCNDHPAFDGMEFSCADADDGNVFSCTCTIHRNDRSKPITITEYFDECSRATDAWKSHPRRMLRHRALMQCARIAFGFSGISDEDSEEERLAKGTVVDVELAAPTPEPEAIEEDRNQPFDEDAGRYPPKAASPKPGKKTETVPGDMGEPQEF